MGIEPTFEAWEAPVLPLNYTREQWLQTKYTTHPSAGPSAKRQVRESIGTDSRAMTDTVVYKIRPAEERRTLPLHQTDQQLPVVGIIPMAGRATRLAGLPCSKELFPIGLAGSGGARRPQAVCEQLLGALRDAGLSDVYVVIRDGKWDIPAYLGDGSRLGLHLAYLLAGRPWGAPYSIDQAYPFIQNRRVALGFPDLHFTDEQVFSRLLAHQAASGADVVLGLFPADRPDKVDMVELGSDNRVKQIFIKPATSQLQHTWGVAVWTPAFTGFMHRFLERHGQSAGDTAELFVGDVFRAGLETGLDVQGLSVSTQPFVDIGTWDDLLRVLR